MQVGLQSSFLEEPVMLLAIVLLGRTLEARARLKASGGHRDSDSHRVCHTIDCRTSDCIGELLQ